eukprot:TRINITY_DN799_c0_g2_i8.p1 TRINITY_DN799_c0_g2~~TRINITY_DN799_c0_g2_i8.p1  ORF type:complete len:213 (+),score=49.79 TRINITY_DN799_c0_g2_i8:45-683(+)
MAAMGWSFIFRVSFVEIYLEEIRDLMCGESIVTDTKGFIVPRYAEVENSETVFQLLQAALQNRAQAETLSNASSSRSHCIFQLRVAATNRLSREEFDSALNLIDLAGCERVDESGASGVRLDEARAINASLSHLAGVVQALRAGARHVPFRNCKLTKYLQPFLSGTAKVLMIVNVSPSSKDLNHTINALKFASTVRTAHVGTAKKTRWHPAI